MDARPAGIRSKRWRPKGSRAVPAFVIINQRGGVQCTAEGGLQKRGRWTGSCIPVGRQCACVNLQLCPMRMLCAEQVAPHGGTATVKFTPQKQVAQKEARHVGHAGPSRRLCVAALQWQERV